ncbi:MAG: hypothetical protein M3452_04410 [Chloroflexota bacterium]|nr:hypothetical protein [Chloroflexota bacterium]
MADGRTFLNSRTQQALMKQWLEDGPKRPDELTPREMEVVKLIAEANIKLHGLLRDLQHVGDLAVLG